MAPSIKESLQKEDLYLLLESYKNSVEMNTVISQQLTSIMSVLKQYKEASVLRDDALGEKIDDALSLCSKIKEKLEDHNLKNTSGIGKLSNKVNLLYVAFGSIVISLVILVVTILNRNHLIEDIARHLGVG
jgi:hypothetical protein